MRSESGRPSRPHRPPAPRCRPSCRGATWWRVPGQAEPAMTAGPGTPAGSCRPNPPLPAEPPPRPAATWPWRRRQAPAGRRPMVADGPKSPVVSAGRQGPAGRWWPEVPTTWRRGPAAPWLRLRLRAARWRREAAGFGQRLAVSELRWHRVCAAGGRSSARRWRRPPGWAEAAARRWHPGSAAVRAARFPTDCRQAGPARPVVGRVRRYAGGGSRGGPGPG
jgi:hypothetical protein